MTLTALVVVAWAITIVLTAFLIWGFVRTRNFGYLVLLIPFTLWHFMSFLTAPVLDTQIGLIDSGRTLTFPFRLLGDVTKGDLVATVQLAGSTIRGLLILLGFYLLIKRTPRAIRPIEHPEAKPLKENVSVPA
jgi:hypothetical protein